MSHLVIVESPAKAKTIKKYLGKGYQVLASYGHVRDLLPKEGAVDPDNNFAMTYIPIERNASHVDAIADALKKHDVLLLATDPDREGEAIAFHVCELLRERHLLEGKQIKRVVFHEITRKAIQDAIAKPREVSMELVDAQRARRGIDLLVGFTLSPLLWRKVRPGLSAGRVQSPALRMLVEREEAIERFQTQEYWTIEAHCIHPDQPFLAKLVTWQGKKLKPFDLSNGEMVSERIQECKQLANGQLQVKKVEKKKRRRFPAAPFTTSTLQQEASRKLGFSASRTMRVAQQLYEGVDVGEGTVGLITYMRTDSVHLADSAVSEIREAIQERYGKPLLPQTPPTYKTKAKNAQEAHEAIRPTDAALSPEQVKHALTDEQFKLYALIWQRTLACQMIPAVINTVAATLGCGPHDFRANGSVIVEPGFLQIYEEGRDDVKEDKAEAQLPLLTEGEQVALKDIVGQQHFTEPPPRYSEATLIHALEECGLGRPSTYATILSTLQQREYAVLENKRFHPTDVGRIVNRFLTMCFTPYVDYGFTAQMEDELDAIARGEKAWQPVMRAFWDPFIALVQKTQETVQRKDVTQEPLDEACPLCGAGLSIRLGRRGRFIGCVNYPECNYTRSLNDKEAPTDTVIKGRLCPQCGEALLMKHGRYGKFIGCQGYPACKHIEPLDKPEDTEVTCPECHKGHLLKRKSRYGRFFYSCSLYPECRYALWYPPLARPCPDCQWPITAIKITKRWGSERVCPQKACTFSEPYNDAAS